MLFLNWDSMILDRDSWFSQDKSQDSPNYLYQNRWKLCQKGVVTNLAGSDIEGELALTDNLDQRMQVS